MGDRAEEAGKRRRRGQVLMRNEPRDQHLDRGPLEAERAGQQAGQQEQQPELVPGQRVDDQRRGAGDRDRLGDQDQPAALKRVGERAADQPGQQHAG